MNKEHLNFLLERKSVRKYDDSVEISNQTIFDILDAAATAPSSNNFQPWKVIVIKNKEIQKELRKLAANQEQVETASALFFILGDLSAYDTDKIIKFNIESGLYDNPQQIEQYRAIIDFYYAENPEDKEVEGLKLDLGLFSMNLMHVVRAFGYDSVAMRGVKFDKVMEYLKVDSNLVPIMFLSVGVALEPGHEKLRFPTSEFLEIIE